MSGSNWLWWLCSVSPWVSGKCSWLPGPSAVWRKVKLRSSTADYKPALWKTTIRTQHRAGLGWAGPGRARPGRAGPAAGHQTTSGQSESLHIGLHVLPDHVSIYRRTRQTEKDISPSSTSKQRKTKRLSGCMSTGETRFTSQTETEASRS